ncbi:vomeronasal type-2 receptor 26-like [Bombina bombina]|uniref:vomeronasal type-2 receptor 26-like n=1 Tax=Bombina bombina TaxID=8345 RepID=UPI00235B0566|nr:vomeronasal type-2 receptor 26-like [Bombina bombina]
MTVVNGSFKVMSIFVRHVVQQASAIDSPVARTTAEPEIQLSAGGFEALIGVEEINSSNDLLPNITLGYKVYESFGSEQIAQMNILRLLTGTGDVIPNYACSKENKIIAFIGDRNTAPSLSMATLTGMYGYSQVSYGAMDSVFDDKHQFPFFFRTVPNERKQYGAILKILHHFGWTWVGIVASDDDSSLKGSQELKELLLKSGYCVAYLKLLIKFSDTIETDILDIFYEISRSTANVVILYTHSDYMIIFAQFLSKEEIPAVAWIITCTLTSSPELYTMLMFNGSLVLSLRKGNIPGLRDFMYSANPQKYPNDNRFECAWSIEFYCGQVGSHNDTYVTGYRESEIRLPPCTGNETLRDIPLRDYDVQNFRRTYSIYTAVYALAHALHTMLSDIKDIGHQKTEFRQWQLRHYLQSLHFSLLSDTIYFDEVGNLPWYYDIVNWILPDGPISIGNFNASAPEKDQFFINTTAIQWHQMFTEIPRSTCSDTCHPGYRKSTRQGQHSCCYDCVPCSVGSITNATDIETCTLCPEDQWSNQGRDTCIPRTVEFLSYEDPLGAALAAVAVVLAVITALVLGLFILNWDSPVVRANNRDLSFLLLFALMLSFFCSLLFIGYPGKGTCKLRQTVFGLFFTVAVSSVLAKTITVVIAFKATKPNSKLRNFLRTSMSFGFVLICSLGQAVICTVWLITSPPYPDYDSQSVTGKMILKCNEGSPIAFYIVVSYLGVLAALSFFVAFVVRKVPDHYNEAKMITFSMLVFCSVWITFIPAYLSSNSKYMVALEIFAITASSSGILGCIFFPKCYIIMLRPDLNKKVNFITKHTNIKT